MTMPPQKPGKSKQDYATPNDFLEAFTKRFGPIDLDLAASYENTTCVQFYGEEQDSLTKNWHETGGNLWLNPPFAKIEPWASKCAYEAERGAKIFLLVPASVGSEWFRYWVYPFAYVLALNPRLTFKGCTTPYIKDMMLCCYGNNFHGFDVWRWK